MTSHQRTVLQILGFVLLLFVLYRTSFRSGYYEGMPSPHFYTPISEYRKAYDFVHSHKCGESWHPVGTTWDQTAQKEVYSPSWGAYYCEGIEGIIFVYEAKP